MLAVQANLLTLLDGRKQFIIPIYQRTYSWTEKQCRQLWDDIVRTAKDDKIPAHFIGSVVYIKASLYDTPTTTPPQLLVIDGQQRLTTLSLLLIALREAIKASEGSSEVTPEEVEDYLTNRNGRGEMRHKLVLTQSDKDTMAAIIDGRPIPASPSVRVMENYRFFNSQIRVAPLSLDTLFYGIQKLMLVDISLDRSHDNPQLIFESLNSTGLDLSQADLIRNFILMGQEPTKQTDLYQDYWYPMEQSFGQTAASGLFDRFMRDYLTIKLGRIPNMYEVYAEFKVYVQSQPSLSIKDVVKDVSGYARLFVTLAFAKAPQKVINAAMADINHLRVDVAYPFLMEAYRDFEQGILLEDDFVRILHLIESYVFRRAICGIPTNSLNNTFAGLYKLIQPDAYLESLVAAFLLKDSYRRFPRDEEFRAHLALKDVYNFRSRNYLLDKLENYGRRETVNVDEFTIEHIMPQTENLAPAWLEDLGEDWKRVHDTYLHTLGNLTLTAYNSEYSARPFLDKRDLRDNDGQPCGFASSPLRLNQGLGLLDHWNEAAIQGRGTQLAEIAVKVWKCPSLSETTLANYQKGQTPVPTTKYSYENHADKLFGDWLPLFDHLRKDVLNLGVTVTETFRNYYVNYYVDSYLVLGIVPKTKSLALNLNIKYADIADPKHVAMDGAAKYVWAKNQTVTMISEEVQINDVMALIKQAYTRALKRTDLEMPDEIAEIGNDAGETEEDTDD